MIADSRDRLRSPRSALAARPRGSKLAKGSRGTGPGIFVGSPSVQGGGFNGGLEGAFPAWKAAGPEAERVMEGAENFIMYCLTSHRWKNIVRGDSIIRILSTICTTSTSYFKDLSVSRQSVTGSGHERAGTSSTGSFQCVSRLALTFFAFVCATNLEYTCTVCGHKHYFV